ncbi:phosphotransferase [Streptomyces sp. NPDC050439]|uniref:phosphotransferase n=1 Tax=unclassified Streptomyces TaxID=2593676 RepID=UPI0034218135
MLVFESVVGRHPDLSLHSADISRVVETLGVLNGTAAPAEVPRAAVEFRGWRRSGAWPERAAELAAWEERCSMAGRTLVHADLRADNMILSGERVLVVDWASAAAGASWVDPVFVCAQLIVAGHTPQAAEQVVRMLPAWDSADPADITAFVVGLCGIWEDTDGALPPELRVYRNRAAAAGRSWIRHRLGWA